MIALRTLMFPALGALAVAVVACGGGGAGSAVVPKGAPTAAAARAQVAIKIVVSAAPANAPARVKRRMAEAASTNGLQIVVYPNPQGTSAPILTQTFDVSPTGGCTTNADSSRTCNETLALAAGTYTMIVTSYDAAPVAGPNPFATAHELGYQFLTPTIMAGIQNAIALSLDGVAAGVSITLPVPIVHTVDALTQQAAVVAVDAAGDAIVANNYVDASGNPVTITLASTSSFFAVTPATFTSPLPSGASVAYSPTGITAAQMLSGVAGTISAALSTGPSASETASAPAALQAAAISAPAYGISAENASTLWFSLPSSKAIQSYVPSTGIPGAPVPLASSSPLSSPVPADVLYNPGDTNVYFTTTNGGALGRIPTLVGTYEQGTSLSADGVTLATDGTNNVWSTEPTTNYLVYAPPSPTAFLAVEQPPPGPPPSAGAGFFQIAFGTGLDMWFTEKTLSKIGMWSATGGVVEASTPTTASGPEGITEGYAGDMWFAENNTNALGEIPSILPATITEYSTGAAKPIYVIATPDGNVWFDYTSPSPGIGRMTAAGVATLFPLPATSSPGQMAIANGQIWVVDTLTSTLYGVTP